MHKPFTLTSMTIRLLAIMLWAVILSQIQTRAQAQTLGVAQLSFAQLKNPVTLWYASNTLEQLVQQGAYTISRALNGSYQGDAPRRLIVISHGSGGSTLEHYDLARQLVQVGFVVAATLHEGDNFQDMSGAGPKSWHSRPKEISALITALQNQPEWSTRLNLKQVGVYGMSAGGFTGLSIAGFEWSLKALAEHCAQNTLQDPVFCAYQEYMANKAIPNADESGKVQSKFVQWLKYASPSDVAVRAADARVGAVVVSVPLSAIILANSQPQAMTQVAFITAGKDLFLNPNLHARKVLAQCSKCELLVNLPNAGHASMLSPWPEALSKTLGAAMQDPPNYDRAETQQTYQKIADYFNRTLKP